MFDVLKLFPTTQEVIRCIPLFTWNYQKNLKWLFTKMEGLACIFLLLVYALSTVGCYTSQDYISLDESIDEMPVFFFFFFTKTLS